jgi:cytochrome d ubiquinol oxidase subunit II
LTVRQAAAPHDTLVAVVVAVIAGGLLLAPALATLFRLTLARRLVYADEPRPAASRPHVESEAPPRTVFLVRIAAALFIAGLGFTNVADAEWAHLLGAACYLGFVAVGFRAAVPLP